MRWALSGFIALVVLAVMISPGAVTGGQPSSCAAVQEALRDYQHVKVGATRGEIERYFARGAAGFPLETRYVYKRCSDIYLDVDFKLGEPRRGMFSPDDVVTRFSKLTLDYPAKD